MTQSTSTVPSPLNGTASAFRFPETSEMGARIRAYDWASTPLGDPSAWPGSLRTMVNIVLNSSFGMYIAWGADYTAIYNDAYRPILGETKHPGALGAPTAASFPEVWEASVRPLFERVMQGEAIGQPDWMLLLDRNGYLEECYFTYSYSPITDENGAIGGVLATVVETTARVLNERRLRMLHALAARAEVYSTIDSVRQQMLETLGKNPADIPMAVLFDFTAQPGAVTTFPTPAHQDKDATPYHNPALWPLNEIRKTGTAMLIDDVRARLGDVGSGQPAPIEQAYAVPLFGADAAAPYAVLVVGLNPHRAFDQAYREFLTVAAAQVAAPINRARAYEDERQVELLAALDRAKIDFLSNISHEFRTPLTLMINPLQELLQAPADTLPTAQRSTIMLAHRNSLRLLKLVNTLLEFARVQTERLQASFEPLDLAMLTADLASAFREAVERAGLALVVDCPPLPEPIYVDREMWEKIVLNLLSNAFKFTFRGGIKISLRMNGDAAELRVQDTGVGIPPHEMPRLFERFHRVRGVRARTEEGSGIGLSLIRELIEAHGGTIKAESELTAGSTFTVRIPRGAAHLLPTEIGALRTLQSTTIGVQPFVEETMRWLADEGDLPSLHDSLPPDGDPLIAASPMRSSTAARPDAARVLIVDDNADMRDYLTSLLAPQYTVETASSGQASQRAIETAPPDLVLMDVNLPDGSGIEIVRALRANPATVSLPVVLLSARASDDMRAAGLAAGADDYLAKPFSARELLARIEARLQMARLRRESLAQQQRADTTIDQLIESIADPFYALDREWRFTYVNQQACAMWGKTREELIGGMVWELFPRVVGTHGYNEMQRAVAENQPVFFETFSQQTGHWYDVNLYPHEGGLSAYFRNIDTRKAAEAEVQARQKRFDAIFNQKSVGIVLARNDGRLIDSNVAFYQMLGYTAQGIVGMTVESLSPPEDYALDGVEYARLVSGESDGYSLEKRFFRSDGTLMWGRITVSVVRGADGTIEYVVGIVEDINEQKRAELAERAAQAEAARNQQRMIEVFNSISDGFISLDSEMRYTYANANGAAFLSGTNRMPIDEIIGKRLAEIVPDYEGGPLDLYLQGVMAEGKPAEFEAFFEPIGKWVQARLFPSKDGLACYLIDTTERHLAQAKLADREKRLQALINQTSVGIVLGNPDGSLLEANGAFQRMLGYTQSEIAALTVEAITFPDDLAADNAEADRVRAGETEGYSLEKRYRRKDGSVLWGRMTSAIVRDEKDEIDFVVGMVEDITERKRAEDAERAAQAAISQEQERRVEMFNSISDGFIAFDREMRYTYLNEKGMETTRRASGRTPEQIYGQSLWEVFPHLYDLPFGQLYRRVLETGQPDQLEEQLRSTNQWMSVRAYPSKDGLGVYFVDTTEQHRAQEAIREAQQQAAIERERRATALDSLSDGFMVFDREWRFTYINPRGAQLALGRADGKPEDLIGGNVWALFPTLDQSPFGTIYHRAMEAGETGSAEAYFEPLKAWFEARAYPSQEGIAVYFVDTTQQRANRAILQAAQDAERQALTQLAGEQQRIVDIFNSVSDGFMTLDREYRYTFFNPRGGDWVARALGRPIEEIQGRIMWEVAPGIYDTDIGQAYRRVMETRQSGRIEAYYAPIDSWFDIRIYPAAAGLSVYFADITAQRRAQTAIAAAQQAERRALEQVAAEQQRVVDIFNNISDGFVAMDRQYRYLYMNELGAEMVRRGSPTPVSEALGKTIWELFPGLYDDVFGVFYRRVLESGQPERLETYYEPMGIWFDIRAYPSKDGLSLYFVDTTAQHEAQRAVLAAQAEAEAERERRIAAFESISDGFQVFDHEWNYTYSNPRGAQISLQSPDATPDMLLGKNLFVLFPTLDDTAFGQMYRRVMASGKLESLEAYFEPMRTWFDVRVYPFSEGVSVYFVDTTETHRTKAALRDAEERLRIIIDSAKDFAILATDLTGVIVSWNAGATLIFGYQPDEIIGQQARALYTPEDRAARIFEQEWGKAASEGYSDDKRWHLRKDGTRFFANGTVRPIFDEDGEMRGFIKVARDETAVHQAERRSLIIQELTTALSSALTIHDVTAAVLAKGVQAVAGVLSGIFMLTDDGQTVERIAALALPDEIASRFQRVPLEAPIPIADSIRRREILWLETADEIIRRYPLVEASVRAGGYQALVCLPLYQRGEVVGGLYIVFDRPRRATNEDTTLMITIAQLCGQAMERAQLYEAEQIARAAAETAAARISQLQALTSALASAVSVEDVAHVSLTHGMTTLGASAATIVLLSDDKHLLTTIDTIGNFNEIIPRTFASVPVTYHAPLTEAVRTGEPVWLHDLEQYHREYPQIAGLTAKQLNSQAFANLPLIVDDHVIGGITFGFAVPQTFAAKDRELMIAVVQQSAQALERARLYTAEQKARAEAEQAAKRMRRLQTLTAALSRTITLQEVTEAMIDQGLAGFSPATAGVYAVTEDGEGLERLVGLNVPEKYAAVYHRVALTDPFPINEVARTRQPIWYETQAQYLSAYPQMEQEVVETNTHAVIIMPFSDETRVMGVFYMSFGQPRRSSQSEMSLLQTMASLCAQSYARAQLYEDEQRARADAERTTERIARLQSLTAALSQAITIDQVAEVCLRESVDPLRAHFGSVALLTPDEQFVDLVRTYGVTSPAIEAYRYVPMTLNNPLIDAIRQGEAVWIETSDEHNQRYPEMVARTKGTVISQAFVSIPFIINDRAIGGLTYTFSTPQTFSQSDKDFILAIGQQCAQALERARLYEIEVEAREAAEEADRLKLLFLGMISHELRTPLQSIKGFSTTLLATDVSWSPEKQRRYLQVISDESDKLTELIEQLLDLSRLQAGNMPIRTEPRRFIDIFDESSVSLLVLGANHRFRLDFSDQLPDIMADTQRISQVLNNLVGNAAKFAPPNSAITIAAAVDGEMMRISVADEGIGIPDDQRETIFEAFQQVERKSSTPVKGAGLGLAICKGIVDAHGGRIWADANQPTGTVIAFTLPLAP